MAQASWTPQLEGIPVGLLLLCLWLGQVNAESAEPIGVVTSASIHVARCCMGCGSGIGIGGKSGLSLLLSLSANGAAGLAWHVSCGAGADALIGSADADGDTDTPPASALRQPMLSTNADTTDDEGRSQGRADSTEATHEGGGTAAGGGGCVGLARMLISLWVVGPSKRAGAGNSMDKNGLGSRWDAEGGCAWINKSDAVGVEEASTWRTTAESAGQESPAEAVAACAALSSVPCLLCVCIARLSGARLMACRERSCTTNSSTLRISRRLNGLLKNLTTHTRTHNHRHKTASARGCGAVALRSPRVACVCGPCDVSLRACDPICHECVARDRDDGHRGQVVLQLQLTDQGRLLQARTARHGQIGDDHVILTLRSKRRERRRGDGRDQRGAVGTVGMQRTKHGDGKCVTSGHGAVAVRGRRIGRNGRLLLLLHERAGVARV